MKYTATEINQLQKDMRSAEYRKMKQVEDTYSYSGWLNSDFMWKRCMAMYGHMVVAYLIIFAGVLVCAFAYGLIGGLFGWL